MKNINILGLLLVFTVVMVAGCVNDSIPEPVENEIQVRIDYEGSWSGKVELEDSLTAVDGSGTEIFDIPGDARMVSAVFQKEDDGPGELTVEILREGEVIELQSTTAAYGVVSAIVSFN